MDEKERQRVYAAVQRLIEQYDFVWPSEKVYTNFFNDLAGILEI